MARRTGNPMLSENTFIGLEATGTEMTLEGTVRKSFLLIGLVMVGALFVWNHISAFMPYYIPIILMNIVVSLIIIFNKKSAPYLVPIYAIIEWILLGTISALFEGMYPGIVLQAVGLTIGIFVSLLLAYQSGWIKATENFKLGITAATGGVAMIYTISFIGGVSSWYHIPFIHEGGLYGIIFSVAVVLIATLNLVLDFDFIESGVEAKAPKYMEWYAAFGLLITLIWLYFEILRLLSKSRGRR